MSLRTLLIRYQKMFNLDNKMYSPKSFLITIIIFLH